MSDFKAKMHKICFLLGLCPRPQWGSLQCSPDPPAVFKGPTSKQYEGEEPGPQIFGLEPAPGQLVHWLVCEVPC